MTPASGSRVAASTARCGFQLALFLIRQSRIDRKCYSSTRQRRRNAGRARSRNGCAEVAFLITAYPTDAIKEGVRIWPK